MSKVAIVTDSSSYLPDDLLSAYNITVAPLVIIWGEEILHDNVDIHPNEFYERLQKEKVMPSTSQATIQAFADAFTKLHNEGYEILAVVISTALSGTYGSAIQAKKMVAEARIELVDSKVTSLPLAYMALAAARAAKAGASLEKCKEIVESIREKTEIYFAVDTLEFLHRGGRIGGASRFLGTALNLKPILTLQDGKIEAVERVRTSKKAHHRLIELLDKGVHGQKIINMIGVVAAAAPEAAAGLLSEIKEKYTPDEIILANLSPAVGTHTGPGTVGVAYVAGIDPEVFNP